MEFRKGYKIGWNAENEKEVKEKGLKYYGFCFRSGSACAFWDNCGAFLGHMLAYMVRNRRAERQAQIKTARIDNGSRWNNYTDSIRW